MKYLQGLEDLAGKLKIEFKDRLTVLLKQYLQGLEDLAGSLEDLAGSLEDLAGKLKKSHLIPRII